MAEWDDKLFGPDIPDMRGIYLVTPVPKMAGLLQAAAEFCGRVCTVSGDDSQTLVVINGNQQQLREVATHVREFLGIPRQ